MARKSHSIRVAVKPALLRWARGRAGLTVDMLATRFPQYRLWEEGKEHPTLKQLEALALKLHLPIGFLFLDEPPDETLPIPDFRANLEFRQLPSPDLLETIYLCQHRQAWYRDYLIITGAKPLSFVGSVTLQDNPIQVATNIRNHLKFSIEERSQISNWAEALRRFIEQVEAAGLLVMASGIVGNNPHRPLNPREFRGFTLIDDLAPLIFINAADTKAAQMFTLAHELAHVWLGKDGVSDPQLRTFQDSDVERWCDQVAAELLVPLEEFRRLLRDDESLRFGLDRLARHFKVSTLVILRRLHEAGKLSQEEFWEAYDQEFERLSEFERRGEGGGNFYNTLRYRIGNNFIQAVLVSTLEGHTLFREAYQLLDIRKHQTFQKLVETMGTL